MLNPRALSFVVLMIVTFSLTVGILLWQRRGEQPAQFVGPATGTLSTPSSERGPAMMGRTSDPGAPAGTDTATASAPAQTPTAEALPPGKIAQSAQAGIIGDIARSLVVADYAGQVRIRVLPGSDKEAFNRSGLKGGDWVVAINGEPLEDPRRSAELWNQVSSGATLTVERRGKRQDIQLMTAP
jgi:hypothetical protein